jgi:hypothetical protein
MYLILSSLSFIIISSSSLLVCRALRSNKVLLFTLPDFRMQLLHGVFA